MTNRNKKFAGRELLLKYWEIIFYLIYAFCLGILALPELKNGYDLHDASFLMGSLRIWAGQVPFRDFYPWYGPLYSYLLALFSALMGNDMYAVKFYIDIVSPLLSMIVLILTLRNFGLPASSRFFALTASTLLGLERIYYCGSLRSFLPVFLISFLYKTYQQRQKLQYLFIFPGACLLFFFSPESGIYTMLTSIIFVFLITLGSFDKKDIIQGVGYFAAAAAIGILVLISLYFGTDWFRNYFEYVSVVSNNLYWSHGQSTPKFAGRISLWAIYCMPIIYLTALIAILIPWLSKRRFGQYSLLVVVLTILGSLLASRIFMSFHKGHIQSVLLPLIIITSLAWTPPLQPLRPRKTALRVLSILLLVTWMPAIVPPHNNYLKQIILTIFRANPELANIYQTIKKRPLPSATLDDYDFRMLLGVRVRPELAEICQKTLKFCHELQLTGKVGIPLPDAEYAYLGRVPEIPFGDIVYSFYPKYQQIFLQALKNNNYTFLIINDENIAWYYTQDSIDSLFDFIDANYYQISHTPPLHIYRIRKNPIDIIKVIGKDEGPFILDKHNNYSVTLRMPDNARPGFVEFTTKFKYRNSLLSRFSMPIVELGFDRKKWLFPKPESGAQRINPFPGQHSFRAYLRYPADTMDVQITFPGIINLPPEQITVTDVRWCEFNLDGYSSPRGIPYILEP